MPADFLKYRNYAETLLDGGITDVQTTLTMFYAEAMPDVPFVVYLTSGLTLDDLKEAERVLCYERDGSTYNIVRDWDNMRETSGLETTITGSEGDFAFPALFPSDHVYFRIGNSIYLHRYANDQIEPPLNRDVDGEAAIQVGESWPVSRQAAWDDGTRILMLLGDVNIEELQYANTPYVLPDHLEAVTLTLSSHLQLGDTEEEDEGIIKFDGSDFFGYKDGEWFSLTQAGGEEGWTPPTASVGDMLIYSAANEVSPTDRINVGDRIVIDGLSVGTEDIVLGDLTITDETLTAGIFTLNLDTLSISLLTALNVVSPEIDLGGLTIDGTSIEATLPLLIEDYVFLETISDYPTVDNGAIVYHQDHGFMVRQAGAWNPIAVTEIENPFPVPADAYATVSFDPDTASWLPSSELLLDPMGAQFGHAIIVGEKHTEAPLVAGMIEYVNNDIQGILRHGESFVRVSLTNLIASQRLPDPTENIIPFGNGEIWTSDEYLWYDGLTLASRWVRLGSSEVELEGTIRYEEGTLQYHNGTGWQDFAGGSAPVGMPTINGSMLVSEDGSWVEADGLSFISGVLGSDVIHVRNVEVYSILEEDMAGINVDGEIHGTKLEISSGEDTMEITATTITGLVNLLVENLTVSGTLRAESLDIESPPSSWDLTQLDFGNFRFIVDEDIFTFSHSGTTLATATGDGVVFEESVTIPELTVDGEVTFNYTIVIGDEMNPGMQDVPGMIRYNGDFQGNLGDGRWASFTLSLADGESGVEGNPEAPFGSSLWWNGSQWYKNAMKIGDEGAILIGSTDTAHPGVIRWNGTNFQGCIDYGLWANLTGAEGGAELPVGTVENSTLRWNGADWIENVQVRSDGIMLWTPLIEIEPYENFYDNGIANADCDVGQTTIPISNFSTVPYGVVRFDNHETLYNVVYATSENMTIEQVELPGNGLTDFVPNGTDIYIQGVLPRPEANGGQIRYNQNDYEGFVENIGWVSFTGHLSVLPTREGDPYLTTGNGLYFDGSIWRAYHNIKFRSDVIEIENDLDLIGNVNVIGQGMFDGVRVTEHAHAIPGSIRFMDNRFQGFTGFGEWMELSSPIQDESAMNGHTLVYVDEWWVNTSLLMTKEDGVYIEPVNLYLDAWNLHSEVLESEIPGSPDLQNTLTFSDDFSEEAKRYVTIFGLSTEELRRAFVSVKTPVTATSLTLGNEDPLFISENTLNVDGTVRVTDAVVFDSSLSALSVDIAQNLRVGSDLYVDDGDLCLLNGSVETYRLRADADGYFGSTVRVGYHAGSSVVGAIRYSIPNNAARGDWEGWDGEQWVSFTAGFHGQAIWGNPEEGDVVAFDGTNWSPSEGMSIIDDVVWLGRTFLPGSVDETGGEIRFTGTQVQALIASEWVVLNGGLPDMPEGSSNGNILYWLEDTWLPTDALTVTSAKIRANSVFELAPYVETTPAGAGQVRYNENDYEAYITGIGWVSLTGHVPFQKPWEHEHQLLWSDGDNWVANESIVITEDSFTLPYDLIVTGNLEVNGTGEITERLTLGAGIALGTEVGPDPYLLYKDAQNRLCYDGNVVGFGEANMDDGIPRGTVYWENYQFRNSAAVRMMTRSI